MLGAIVGDIECASNSGQEFRPPLTIAVLALVVMYSMRTFPDPIRRLTVPSDWTV